MANAQGEDASETGTHTLQARGGKELEGLSCQLGEDALQAEIEMALAKT